MTAVTCVCRACTEPSEWPIRSSMSLDGVPSSSTSVLRVCRRPCVRPGAIGTQQASARAMAFRPRTGRPGQGSASTGTGRVACGAFFAYEPVAAGWNSHVAKPLRRQCAAGSADHAPGR